MRFLPVLFLLTLVLAGCALHPLRNDWIGHDCVRRVCPPRDPCADAYGPLGPEYLKRNQDCKE